MTAIRLARGRHRAAEGREVRRQLPRPRRRAARRGRQRRGHARPARRRRASRPPRSPTPSSRRTTSCPTLDDDVACVIVEPVAANMGLVAPAPGFLEGLRAACDRGGALLIFDEVITGFRVGLGGAQARYGVKPDLTLLRQGDRRRPAHRRVRRSRRRDGSARPARARVPGRHAVGEPAGHGRRARRARPARRRRSTSSSRRRPTRLAAGLRAAFAAAGVAVQVPVVGPLVGLHFAPTPAVDYDDRPADRRSRVRRASSTRCSAWRGARPGAYEVLFPGAHDRSPPADRRRRRRAGDRRGLGSPPAGPHPARAAARRLRARRTPVPVGGGPAGSPVGCRARRTAVPVGGRASGRGVRRRGRGRTRAAAAR